MLQAMQRGCVAAHIGDVRRSYLPPGISFWVPTVLSIVLDVTKLVAITHLPAGQRMCCKSFHSNRRAFEDDGVWPTHLQHLKVHH